MRVSIFMMFVVASLMAVSTVGARQLFWDDFESEQLGAEPSRWKKLNAGVKEGGEIVVDPKDRDNKVFSMPDRFVSGPRDNGEFYVIGDESWTDYIAEWDWMPAAGAHGMTFRFQNEEEYYLIDKKHAQGIVKVLIRAPAPMWTEFGMGPWLWEPDEWYRVRLDVKGDRFVFKVRALDAKSGTAAKVRVLIESSDGEKDWGTVGVSSDIIEASWEALVESIEYKLLKDKQSG